MGNLTALIAPAATIIAAVMTAANLGARITGWGFVVFTFGSICWAIIGVESGQMNLVVTNVFLTLVNVIGVWRWLGRQARYEAVSVAAEHESAAPATTSVFAASGLVGRKIVSSGAEVGEAVDALIDCRTGTITHVVARFGGVGGIGERLVSIAGETLAFQDNVILTTMSAATVRALPAVEEGKWESLLLANAHQRPTHAIRG